MQTIRTFGDSFLFGTDLKDAPASHTVDEPWKYYSKLTWPALLSKQFDVKYECFARGGASNSLIARKIFQTAEPTTLNVIQWTWIDRYEYVDRETNAWQPIRPSEQNDIAENYYKNFHSELQDKWINLNIIANTLQCLESKNIPYVCHVLDQLLLDQTHHAPEYVQHLQEYLAPRIAWFPERTTFFEWAKLNKFPISDSWHPLEQAHQEAAKIWQSTYEPYCK